MRETPSDFIYEDWLLIAEALVDWAGEPYEILDDRQIRAYQLVEYIALDLGLSLDEMAEELDIDHELAPPEEN